jgi:hypothetical protein
MHCSHYLLYFYMFCPYIFTILTVPPLITLYIYRTYILGIPQFGSNDIPENILLCHEDEVE